MSVWMSRYLGVVELSSVSVDIARRKAGMWWRWDEKSECEIGVVVGAREEGGMEHVKFMRRCTGRDCSWQQSDRKLYLVLQRTAVRYDRSTHRNRVLPRMPARVQDLLVEVERLERHVLPQTPRPHAVLHARLVAW